MDKVFVQAAVGIVKSLGIITISEFVENQDFVEIIKDSGVDYGQGYHLGKPKPDFFD